MSRVRPRAVIVSVVMPFPETSGGCKRTMRLIEAIEDAGAQPHVLTADAGQAGAADALRARGWVVEAPPERPAGLSGRLRQHLARRPSPYLYGVAANLRKAARGAAFVQFEHAQSAYYWRAIGGAKTVLSMHNVDSEMLETIKRASRGVERARLANRAAAMRSIEHRAVSRADVVLAVCEHDRLSFERRARRVLEVPNGIDDELFMVSDHLPETEDVLFFGHFGYAPNRLGIERFLREGWPELARTNSRARLLLVGPGLAPDFRREAAKCERVVALGWVADLRQVLDGSRAVIAPLWQGGGTKLKVLEALAAARPLVGTEEAVGGVGICHERDALVVATPVEMAAAVSRLLADRDFSAQLSSRGRALAERYRWTRTLQPAIELYSSWLPAETAGESRASAAAKQ